MVTGGPLLIWHHSVSSDISFVLCCFGNISIKQQFDRLACIITFVLKTLFWLFEGRHFPFLSSTLTFRLHSSSELYLWHRPFVSSFIIIMITLLSPSSTSFLCMKTTPSFCLTVYKPQFVYLHRQFPFFVWRSGFTLTFHIVRNFAILFHIVSFCFFDIVRNLGLLFHIVKSCFFEIIRNSTFVVIDRIDPNCFFDIVGSSIIIDNNINAFDKFDDNVV